MSAEEPVTGPGEAIHSHRWRIGEQDGPTSTGTCDCGAERAFPNTLNSFAPRAAHWRQSGRSRTG